MYRVTVHAIHGRINTPPLHSPPSPYHPRGIGVHRASLSAAMHATVAIALSKPMNYLPLSSANFSPVNHFSLQGGPKSKPRIFVHINDITKY